MKSFFLSYLKQKLLKINEFGDPVKKSDSSVQSSLSFEIEQQEQGLKMNVVLQIVWVKNKCSVQTKILSSFQYSETLAWVRAQLPDHVQSRHGPQTSYPREAEHRGEGLPGTLSGKWTQTQMDGQHAARPPVCQGETITHKCLLCHNSNYQTKSWHYHL